MPLEFKTTRGHPKIVNYWRDGGYVELLRLHGRARIPIIPCDQLIYVLEDIIEQRATAKAVFILDASRKLARSVETNNGLE